ncbi:hypothetical protein B0H94_11852 [Salsuginibacillus halophilus]|uniref:Uncharacterized protein n=1 Tax=Salsuginibacillus halophilus TaxID=517424 RepID=A0A2P8H6B1_9BACI|nr:hypothetical protein [Salsuginibacillus halophilus]PSL41739.1 hypothetical protein B0H94_11852 [Salsuginibacillus halophilus]
MWTDHIEEKINSGQPLRQDDLQYLLYRAKEADRLAMKYENTGAMFARGNLIGRIRGFEEEVHKALKATSEPYTEFVLDHALDKYSLKLDHS